MMMVMIMAAAAFMVMVVMMVLMLVIMVMATAAFMVMVVMMVLMLLMVMATAALMVVIVMMMLMLMSTFRAYLFLHHLICQRYRFLHNLQNLLTIQFFDRSGNDGSLSIDLHEEAPLPACAFSSSTISVRLIIIAPAYST